MTQLRCSLCLCAALAALGGCATSSGVPLETTRPAFAIDGCDARSADVARDLGTAAGPVESSGGLSTQSATSAPSPLPASKQADPSAASTEDMNESNNPLTPAPGIDLQDYYASDLYGSNDETNDILLRGTLPVAPGVIPVPQLFRLTVPISTRPEADGDDTSGLGDVSIFDIFMLGKPAGIELGIGPLLTIPTATDGELGTDKWQAGLAALAILPTPEGVFGGLVQWQTSFAGSSSAPDVSTLTLQPFVIYNVTPGWYLRSTGIWTFDLENGHYYIPIGFGGGAVWKQGKNLFNIFIEPQITIAHDGAGLPQMAIFFGINTTFG